MAPCRGVRGGVSGSDLASTGGRVELRREERRGEERRGEERSGAAASYWLALAAGSFISVPPGWLTGWLADWLANLA